MAEQLRTRSISSSGTFKCLDPSSTYLKEYQSAERCTISEKLINYQLFTDEADIQREEWVLHSEKGPAIVGGRYSYYYVDGHEISKKYWEMKFTKLGKVLYG
jgi:hypothetical protein